MHAWIFRCDSISSIRVGLVGLSQISAKWIFLTVAPQNLWMPCKIEQLQCCFREGFIRKKKKKFRIFWKNFLCIFAWIRTCKKKGSEIGKILSWPPPCSENSELFFFRMNPFLGLFFQIESHAKMIVSSAPMVSQKHFQPNHRDPNFQEFFLLLLGKLLEFWSPPWQR